MSDWTDAGLPCTLIDGYGYGIASMLLRTPMDSGATRQRRFRDYDRKEFALTYDMTTAELTSLLSLLDAKAYEWMTMPLVDGINGSITPGDKTVRAIQPPGIDRKGENSYAVTLKVEDQGR